MSTIVVGVDGSPESKAALRWAIAEAGLRGARLRAVHAWVIPAAFGADAALVLAEAIEGFREEGERVLDEALAEVAGESGPDVPVEREVVQGPASECLLRAAADADLLVLGSRGRGGFAGLLLGSVSQQCTHHAPCAVVIVRRQA
jgi:nucleotide-binding universal stress UspA family protein